MFPEGMVFLVAARKLVLQGSSDGFPKQKRILSPGQASDLKRSPGIPYLWRSLGRGAGADSGGRQEKDNHGLA